MKYSNRIENLTNELAAIGNDVTELEKKRALLRRLRAEFSVTSQFIRSSKKPLQEATADLVVF